ncbi:MAG: hypothetical protein SPL10_06690 [Synergistales bacterium]|nr:hypothetical protein [Synergistales bacterium]MDY6401905.1 hypothetical protein [Synergistales bacterium]MDY6403919.1 hypothetical protein [Synergistales bacterium]MDY6411283.1 hypothetical protein [Synergistales bacterium]MDY6414827.1 hypothetical protein [Synergistales bacterium]
MLTLNALGRHGAELVNFFRGSLKDNESELKILIDGPIQVEEIRKFLEPLGFSDFILEDNDGNLYLMTSRKSKSEEKEIAVTESAPIAEAAATVSAQTQQPEKVSSPKEININKNINKEINIKIKHSTGVLISCRPGKYKNIFMKKILMSLVNSKIKPEVLGLMNGAVNLAVYNSAACDCLKELEAAGVKILISESCADFMGITETVGAGNLVDMSEIFEEIFSCEKVISL